MAEKYCQQCGAKLTRKNKKNDSGMCVNCYAAKQLQASGIIMQASGYNGQVELLQNAVRIRRKGKMAFLSQGLKGEKEIQIRQISSIQFKSAGNVTYGFLQFMFLGGAEHKGGYFDANKDENTVTFLKKQQPAFDAIKRAIEQRIEEVHGGTSATQQPPPQSVDAVGQIERLAALRDQGVLTEQEFQAKKQDLLSRV